MLWLWLCLVWLMVACSAGMWLGRVLGSAEHDATRIRMARDMDEELLRF